MTKVTPARDAASWNRSQRAEVRNVDKRSADSSVRALRTRFAVLDGEPVAREWVDRLIRRGFGADERDKRDVPDLEAGDLLVAVHDPARRPVMQLLTVLADVPCAALIIPAEASEGEGVLAAVSSAHSAGTVAAAAAREAQRLGEPLRLLHVVPPGRRHRAPTARILEPALRVAREAARREAPDLAARCMLSMVDPRTGILEAARGARLLVMSAGALHPHGCLSSLLVSAPCPLLVVKPVERRGGRGSLSLASSVRSA